MTWYIDTLDPRAGLAFASERTPDLLGQPDDVWDLDDEVSTVFVRAPGFLVEPVPNRAVALAAARGSFQFGLFVDGLEAPFDSVDDVREFVRRAYLRASGGDPGPGGEVPGRPEGGPPESEGEAPSPEPAPEGDPGEFVQSPFVKVLRGWADEFLHAFAGRELGAEGTSASWEVKLEKFEPQGSDGPLFNAAYLLLEGVLARVPYPFDPLEDDAAWFQSATALGIAIERLGLSYGLEDRFRKDGDLIRLAWRVMKAPDRPLGWLPPDANLDTVTSSLFGWLRDAAWRWARWRDRPWDWDDFDPSDLVARLPLPEAIDGLLMGAWAPEGRRSVMHLLGAAIASPQMLRATPPPAPVSPRDPPDVQWSAAELVLFAAALINGPSGEGAFSVGAAYSVFSKPDSALMRAMAWLSANMPERALPEVLETIIERHAIACAYAPSEGEP